MEIFSTQFLTALMAIIVIDLMLAGDNAIVIALAARKLPPHLQKRAIVWGMAGAVAVRSSMTLIVVWLLQIPGLLFAGGAVLVWIAYRLLLPDPDDAHDTESHQAPSTFWGAMRTIVIADAVMGLDNVLGVAGAAHGSYLLVVLGLLISIPIVVFGSTMLLRWVERFPVIVYIGSGVLALTAVKMITSEPLLAGFFASNGAIVPLLYMVVVVGVLWIGFVKNHRHLESRIHARLAELAALESTTSPTPTSVAGDAMHRVLIPVVGSANDDVAIDRVVTKFTQDETLEVHLLSVQAPMSRHVARLLRSGDPEKVQRDESEKALQRSKRLLEEHRIPYCAHVCKGDRAQLIVDEARRLECDRILMSAARKKSLTRMVQDATTNKVLQLSSVPVEIVAGDEISGLERYGVPVVLVAALAILVAAAVL